MTALFLVQACSQGLSSNSNPSQSGTLNQVQQVFPTVQSVDPIGAVSVTASQLTCSGSCTVILTDSNLGAFSSIGCTGNLTVNNNQIDCDNALTLAK